MSELSIFEFSEYKAYLIHRLGFKGQRKGEKSALARWLRCQPTFISQVVNGHHHLSLEQGQRATTYFALTQEESQFFMLLLLKDRAGSQELKAHFQDQIQSQLNKRMVLVERLGKSASLSDQDKAQYYSSWLYAAVHVALTIPHLRTKPAIAKHLGIGEVKVSEVLEFLTSIGLSELREGEYFPILKFILLGKGNYNLTKHHSNWRQRAIESLEHETLEDLHYSGVFSMSKKDAAKIKDLILEWIKKNLSIVEESKEEDLRAICVDFFSVGHSHRLDK